MRFWPISVIATSPMLPLAYRPEIDNICNALPGRGAFYACIDVAMHTQAVEAPTLHLVRNIGSQTRRLYIGYPDTEAWLRLERACVMQDDSGETSVFIDALN